MIAEEHQVQKEISETIGNGLLPETSYTIFKENLATYIRELISNDFEKLVRILYRLDINEKRLKSLLVNGSSDSGVLIADLIIERQLQKIQSRKQFSNTKKDIPEEDKW